MRDCYFLPPIRSPCYANLDLIPPRLAFNEAKNLVCLKILIVDCLLVWKSELRRFDEFLFAKHLHFDRQYVNKCWKGDYDRFHAVHWKSIFYFCSDSNNSAEFPFQSSAAAAHWLVYLGFLVNVRSWFLIVLVLSLSLLLIWVNTNCQ